MPQPLPTTDFHAQHSPFGAFASFTLGRYGKRGGFGRELSGPAEQDVYIGIVRPGKDVETLPFFAGAEGREAEAYTGQSVSGDAERKPPWKVFGSSAIQRSLGWATDTWKAGAMTFTLFTPFGAVPDPVTIGDGEMRRHLCPAIFAELTIDNREGDAEAFGFFGIGATDPLRPLSDSLPDLCGMACANEYGFAVVPAGDPVWEVQSWQFEETLSRATGAESLEKNRLANRGGVVFPVAPGVTRTVQMALAFFRDGVVTSGVPTSYLYSHLFADLNAVLEYAVANADSCIAVARERDAELDAAPLSDERRFLLAHATHSYHGATMLLHDVRGMAPRAPFALSTSLHRPVWVVNEGEYRMLNTFDLTVDHAFFELLYHPWTLRNTLDLFVHRYSYIDEVQDATSAERPHFPGGISFTHDMGVANQFTPPGQSSYERPDLAGCFSFMTMEQLCNFCLCAALYGLATTLGSGDLLWLAARRNTLHACLTSLLRRDGPENLRNGVMSFDAARCGDGQEITTYDSLDPSLGQARGNGYLAVKTWAAYLALSRCFDTLGDEAAAAESEEMAARAAATIAGQFDEETEMFPAIFEKGANGYAARTLPMVEGLIYPYLWGDDDAISSFGRYGQLISQLRRHLKAALVSEYCVDAVSGGLKMSSSSENTWMSKLFLIQFIAEHVLGLTLSPEYDCAHACWQREGDCRDFAFTDQVRSTDGKDLGSRFYPRGVTAVLWTL